MYLVILVSVVLYLCCIFICVCMYVTSWGAPRTGLPFVLPVSFDKIDNNNYTTNYTTKY